MKTKIFFSVAIISSLIIFFVLFKGLQNTNIYTPQVDVKKDIPYFEAKIFDSDIVKNSNEIFQNELGQLDFFGYFFLFPAYVIERRINTETKKVLSVMTLYNINYINNLVIKSN